MHRKLCHLLSDSATPVNLRVGAIRCLINISVGDEFQASALLSLKLLDVLNDLILSTDARLRKDVYHLLSNLFS
jgi:hypothetical protein